MTDMKEKLFLKFSLLRFFFFFKRDWPFKYNIFEFALISIKHIHYRGKKGLEKKAKNICKVLKDNKLYKTSLDILCNFAYWLMFRDFYWDQDVLQICKLISDWYIWNLNLTVAENLQTNTRLWYNYWTNLSCLRHRKRKLQWLRSNEESKVGGSQFF